MKTGNGRRWAALLLCLAMLLSMVGAAAPASSPDPETGLCEHHPEHTADCGYAAPTEGSPCTHVHDGACGYAAPVPETPCNKGCTDTGENGVIIHAPGCAYTPATEGSPCQHVHDESCGYAAPTEGSPCQYVCEICGAAGSTDEPEPEPTDEPEPDPEPTEAPVDPSVPGDVPAPEDGPSLDEPSADGEPAPIAEGANMTFESVMIDGTVFAEDGSATVHDWEYDQVKQLAVRFKTNSDPGKVRITVPAGLNITSYTSEGFSGVEESKHPGLGGGYPGGGTASLTYTVNSVTTEGVILVSIGVDKVLWPKTDPWTTGAIKVELLTADGELNKTQSAKAEIVRSKSETGAVYNVIQSDANASVLMEARKEFRLKNYQVVGNLSGTPMGGYFKSVTVTMSVPYDTSDNTYATYVRVASNSTPASVTPDTGAHTLTITWNNVYLSQGNNLTFIPYFQWEEARTKTSDGTNQIKLEMPPTATLVCFDDTRIDNVQQSDAQTNFNLVADIQLVNSGTTKSIYSWHGSDSDKVYQFGQFLVENTGFENSGPLTLTFDYSADTQIGVTAQRIPGTVTDVKYTSRRNGSLQDGKSLLKDNTLFAPEGDYFTQIVATVAGLEPGAGKYYNHSAPLSPGNQCVTFGKLLAPGNFTVPNIAALKIEGAAGNLNGITASTASFNLTVDSAEQAIPLTLAPTSGSLLDETEVEAGSAEKTAHFSGVISTTSYPYSNNVTAMSPVIYVRLPDGVTMENLTIKSGETAVTPASQDDHSDWGGEGFHVYKISFTGSEGQVGWFKEDLTETRLTLDFNIVAGIDAHSTTLPMRDCVLVAYNENGNPALSGSNYGSLSANIVSDTHDVDGDTNVAEQLCTVQQAQNVSLTITPARRGLHFEARAKLDSEREYYNYSVSALNSHLDYDNRVMYLTQSSDTIQFQLTAENNTGAALDVEGLLKEEPEATDFFCYYVPIPKIGDNIDAHFQPSEFELDMMLDKDDPCTIAYGDWEDTDAFTVQYGHVDHNNYTDAGQYHSDYQRGTSKADADNMVRITLNTDVKTIPAGTKVTVNLNYVFELEAEELVGQYVEFGACGQSLFTTDGTPSSGHSPTQRVRAELQTGRIAGRVFVDTDYSGSYTAGDAHIAFTEDTADPEQKHQAFYDVDGDDVKDPEDVNVEMDIYATGVETPHHAQKPTFDSNKFENTYAISSLRANTYTLTITNPGYTDGVPEENSLKFIELKQETESSRSEPEQLAPASTYEAGYRENTTASIAVNADSVNNNRMRDIGLQRPHKVTFKVTYVDTITPGYSPTSSASQVTYVWHGETATDPGFTLDGDFQWQGGDGTKAEWKLEGSGTAFGEPITSTEWEITYTATAVRVQHQVSYNDNYEDGEADNMPDGPTAGVNGQDVPLSENIPTRTDTPDGKAVVFIGWTKAAKPIEARGDSKKSTAELDCVTSVLMGTTDITVYALWGYDENGDGTADALEDRYTLHYDANGGTNAPAEESNLLAGETVTLAERRSMTEPADAGGKVLFMGWTENSAAQTKIYSKDDYNSRDAIDRSLTSTVTMPAANKTVYAVWALDENNNDTPDYQEGALCHVIYDVNGGDTPGELTDAQNTGYLPKTKVTLWKPSGSWTKGSKELGTQAVFVGWRADDTYGETSVKTAPTDIIETVETPEESGPVTVYAVWAEDKNGNGTADYNETQITIRYEMNGGTGAGDFSDQTGLVKGASYLLADGSGLTREDPGHPIHRAVFAGWSRVKIDTIVPEDTEGPAVDVLGIVPNPYRIPDDAAGTITLYAVYGADNNGDGIADFKEDAQHVEYYPNGGQDPKTGELLPDDKAFWTCDDHHVFSEPVDLQPLDTMAELIRRDGAVLIGWSETPHKELFTSPPIDGVLIKQVTIPAKGMGNAKVYAVWAADENGNHKADYDDPHYSQWYYRNSALADWRPGTDDIVANTKEAPIHDANVDGYPEGVAKIEYGTDKLPGEQAGILAGSKIDVPGPTLESRTDYDADGNVLHHYVQLGWSGFCHPAATSMEQANRWLIEANDEDREKPGNQRTIVDSMYQYNFAVWALDDNHNGLADFDEKPYTLRYDRNGGSGEVPGDEEYLPGTEVTLDTETAPVRTQAIFLGWSTEKHDLVTSQADEDAWRAKTVTMPAASAPADDDVVTVYALWAVNENAAGKAPDNTTPDYRERHTLRYDANPIVGAVSGMPDPLSQEYGYGTEAVVTDAKPVHGDVDGRHVVFVGWSDGRTELARSRAGTVTIYHAGDKLKIGAYDLTLYAVWNYEEETKAPAGSGSGTADKTNGAPGTGDEARPELWAALLALCAIVPAVLAVPLTKKRRTDR